MDKMKFVVLSILLITFTYSTVECVQQGDFISITEAPYFASLIFTQKNITCGAAILSEYWVISAAHCVKYMGYSFYDMLQVRTGATSDFSNGNIHTIDRVVLPDNYDIYESNFTDSVVTVNDITLIKLNEPIKFNEYQQPIRLRSSPVKENDTVVIVGLGKERLQEPSPSLKKSVQSVVTVAPPLVHKPPSVFHLKNSTSHYCPGDSGSPGVIDKELAGIVVFVDEICEDWSVSHVSHYPGALTRIDLFYNWILKHTEIKY